MTQVNVYIVPPTEPVYNNGNGCGRVVVKTDSPLNVVNCTAVEAELSEAKSALDVVTQQRNELEKQLADAQAEKTQLEADLAACRATRKPPANATITLEETNGGMVLNINGLDYSPLGGLSGVMDFLVRDDNNSGYQLEVERYTPIPRFIEGKDVNDVVLYIDNVRKFAGLDKSIVTIQLKMRDGTLYEYTGNLPKRSENNGLGFYSAVVGTEGESAGNVFTRK